MESRNWIGGEWTSPTAGSLAVLNPSDVKEEIGVLHLSGESDVHEAATAARVALSSWSRMLPSARGEVLYKMAAVLEQQLNEVAVVASREMGKPVAEMRGEVKRGVDLLRYYAAEGVRQNGAVIPSTQVSVLQYTRRVALGVVAVITPWNFPVAIPIWKMAPALICGNTVVWKPAEFASLTAVKLAELFASAGLPAGVLNLVIGKGSVVGTALLEKEEIDAVSFTGSTQTGMSVASAAAKRNIKYQTEMGGKNAAIVLADADLTLSVNAVLSGAFRSAGQKCTATSRVIVEKAIYNEFQARLRDELARISCGSALLDKTYVGPVASKSQFAGVMEYANLAQKDARVIAKGNVEAKLESGYYVQPLVVDGVDASHRLVQEEVFGPLMTLLPADNLDHALELCNKTVYGLSAAVFTRDITKGMRFLDEAEAGMVRINLETAGVEYQAPFGGMKMSSSHSREQGQAALDFYSQLKTCAVYYG